MKTHIILFFIALLNLQCLQPTATAQVSNSGFSKKIKTIENYRTDFETGDKKYLSTEHFDKLGNMVKRFSYNTYPDEKTNEQNCTYDADGNMKCITTDESGKQVHFYEKIYEGKNVVEEKSTYETKKYTHDKNGNVLLEEEFDSEGNFSRAKKYELEYLDGTSNLKSITTFEKRGDGDFKRYEENKYTYNKNGKLEIETARTNFYNYRYTHTYYPNGNLKEKTTENGDTEKIITRYNKNGKRRVEAIFRSDAAGEEMKLAQKNKWTYDEQDNEILAEHFRNEKLVSKRVTEITYW